MLSASRNPFIVLEWSFVSQKWDNPNIEFGSAKTEPKFNICFHDVWTQNSGPKSDFIARTNGEILQLGYNEYSTNVITTDYQTTIKLIN